MMLPGLVRQDGYDYTAIRVVFDQWEKETGRQSSMIMLAQIEKLIGIIENERQKKRDRS